MHGESLTTTEQLSNLMNLPGKHSSFNISFDGPTGLYDALDPQLHHQGMSVQTLDSSCPPYFSQPATDQNNAGSVHPLTRFRITSLTQPVSNAVHKSNLPTIPVSYIVGYVPENSVEPIDHASLIISSSYHCVQSSLSGNEPGIRDQIPANRLNSDHQLTNLPAKLANPQDSRPVAVANPPNLQQAKSGNPVNATKIVADKSSQAKCRNNRRRQRYRNDPVYAERERERLSRHHKNPAYLERRRERRRERQRERRKDPDYTERERKHQRERYRNDPAFAERRKTQQNERYKTDLAYAERKKKLERERRHNNPILAQRIMARYRNDPVYAECRRIYNRVYYRMKNKVGKEEAAKLAATARKEYLQSVNCPGDSGDLPQNSTSAATTQNANENSDALPLENKPDIRESASANLLSPDYHLTNLPAEPANPQDSRPVAVASPPRVEVSENLPSSISESPGGAQASDAAGQFFTSPPKQMPMTTLDSKERCQDEASEVSVTPKKGASSSELEIKIVRVWSMALEEGSHFFNNSHSDIQTSLIVQADNPSNEVVRRCVTQKNAITRRQPIHQGKKPYKCDQCDLCFAKKSYLKRHQIIHTDAKPYECKQCDKRFARQYYLKIHQTTHTELKPYKCKQCDKCFARKDYLKGHQATHTELKPYKCKQCDKCFAQKRYLTTHQDVHAGKSIMGASSAAKSSGLKTYRVDIRE